MVAYCRNVVKSELRPQCAKRLSESFCQSQVSGGMCGVELHPYMGNMAIWYRVYAYNRKAILLGHVIGRKPGK
jgi:hypothetical protein